MMIRSWSSKHPSRLDPADIDKVATDSIAKVKKQQPRVNALTSYLAWRTDQNGFGEDFEFTIRTKEA